MKQFSEAFGRKLDGSGITRIQWIVLYYINEADSISQRELAQLMRVKDSSIGRLIDRLERDGLLIRQRSAQDRRVINVEMTDKGSELFHKIIHLGEEFNDELTRGIPKEDLKTFDRVLKQMLLNVQE